MKGLKLVKLLTPLLIILSMVFGISFIVQQVEAKSDTKFILDNATGGDCILIGSWDSITKTCVLTNDLTGAIQIYGNGLTLDGAGHTIKGIGYGTGVYVHERVGVTIKNLNVKNFKIGIFLYSSSGNIITDNIVNENNWYGIYLDSSSNNNIITNNTANSNRNFGIYLHTSSNNDLTGNIANLNVQYGIYLFASSNNNILTNNIAYGNRYGIYLFAYSNNNILSSNIVSSNGYGIYLHTSSINDLTGNVIIENKNVGIVLVSSNNNKVYSNNFINNPSQAVVRSSNDNVFTLAAPIGGNYWSNYDTGSKGCIDSDSDGFCDALFVFRGGQDNLPWHRDGWAS